MQYQLEFRKEALREWEALDNSIRLQFKKKLTKRLACPRIVSDRLNSQPDRYKIKLRSAGYRLIYEVHDQTVTVTVIAIGKRNRNAVYRVAMLRP